MLANVLKLNENTVYTVQNSLTISRRSESTPADWADFTKNCCEQCYI